MESHLLEITFRLASRGARFAFILSQRRRKVSPSVPLTFVSLAAISPPCLLAPQHLSQASSTRSAAFNPANWIQGCRVLSNILELPLSMCSFFRLRIRPIVHDWGFINFLFRVVPRYDCSEFILATE